MSYKLLYFMGNRIAGKGKLRSIDFDLQLPFVFDGIDYYESRNINKKFLNNEVLDLTSEEISEIKKFIDQLEFNVWIVDNNHNVVNKIKFSEYNGKDIIAYSPPPPSEIPGHFYYNTTTDTWIFINGVDKNKKFIGNVPFAQCEYIADSTPTSPYDTWDTVSQSWKDVRSIDEIRSDVINDINVGYQLSITSTMLINGEMFCLCEEAMTKLNELVKTSPNSTMWYTSDKKEIDLSTINLTVSKLKDIIQQYIQEKTTQKNEQLSRANAANSINELSNSAIFNTPAN